MAGYSLTTEQADALLQRLTTDEDFRTLFVKDLAAAFEQLPGGPKPPPDLEPGCCLRPRNLATTEQLAAARAVLQRELTSNLSYIPHLFEG